MDGSELLIVFLQSLVTAAGTGLAVFKLMEFLKKVWPRRAPALAGDIAFYLAFGLSFAVPLLAYAAISVATSTDITWAGLFAAGMAGYAASQKIYRDSPEKAVQAATEGGSA